MMTVSDPIVLKNISDDTFGIIREALQMGMSFDPVPLEMGDGIGVMLYFDDPGDAVWFKLKFQDA